LVTDPESKEPAVELTKQTTAGARDRGLILLSCGTYANVIRILVPLVIDDDDLARGLEILEESLVVAARISRPRARSSRSEEHTSALQSRGDLVCRLL